MSTTPDVFDVADKVEHTYYAMREADDAERAAQARLMEIAQSYASCTWAGIGFDEAEDQLIRLGDAAIELDERRQAFETCQHAMKRIWQTIPIRGRA